MRKHVWGSKAYASGAQVRALGPCLLPQLTWPEHDHALEPELEVLGCNTEAALTRKLSNTKILLGYASDSVEAQSLDYFLLAHGYDVRLATSNQEFLKAARDSITYDAIVADQTISNQTLDSLCCILQTFFVPIIEFSRTQPRKNFVSAIIPKPCKTVGLLRKLDAVISIARDVRQTGCLRAQYSELVELDRLFGPSEGARNDQRSAHL